MYLRLKDLERKIMERAFAGNKASYTVSLLAAGKEKCGKKVVEEAGELALAVMRGERKDIVGEGADLVYHLLVLLKAADVSLDDIERELLRRDQQLCEDPKANRRGT